MFSVSAKEAAQLLGVSKPRVYQLVKQGVLEAEHIGRTLLISADSVKKRIENPVAAGRPPRVDVNAGVVQNYMLMNREHEVFEFTYDPERDEFIGAGNISDPLRAPLGLLSPRGAQVSKDALTDWWRHRSIPSSRDGIDMKLAELGIEHPYQIPFKSLGLSLSDQYWVRPYGMDVEWKDINYFDNDFEYEVDIESWNSSVGLSSPDNTSDGMLPKRWVIAGGKRLLLKGASNWRQEPYNEVIATALFERVLEPEDYVRYIMTVNKTGAVSVCDNFLSNEEEFIPALYVRDAFKRENHHSEYFHYLLCCGELGVANVEQAMSKMLVCDDIIGNTDRHWRNFGIIRNVQTLQCRVAPIFDSGNSLWYRTPMADLERKDYRFKCKPFYEDPKRQLSLIGDCGWLSYEALEGFVEQLGEILSRCDCATERVSYIQDAVQTRIDRIKYLYPENPEPRRIEDEIDLDAVLKALGHGEEC